MSIDPISMLIETRMTVALLCSSHKEGEGQLQHHCWSVGLLNTCDYLQNEATWSYGHCRPLLRNHIAHGLADAPISDGLR